MKIKIRELLEDRKDIAALFDTLDHLKPSGLTGYNMLHIKADDAGNAADALRDYANLLDAIIDGAAVDI